ncbi:MAG: ribosomal protein S18 acetylase RimI-like enzyme, partial [Acidimicrobiales bacterium]
TTSTRPDHRSSQTVRHQTLTGTRSPDLQKLIGGSRLNLGRILVQRTIDDARRRGCGDMGVYLVPTTEGNRGFYTKLGFEVIGTEMRQTF